MKHLTVYILFILNLPLVFAQKGPSVIDMGYFFKENRQITTEYMYASNGEFLLKYDYDDPRLLSAYLVSWESSKSDNTYSNELLTALCNEDNCLISFKYDTLRKSAYHTVILRDEQAETDYVLPIESNPQFTSPLQLMTKQGEWISSTFIKTGTEVMLQPIEDASFVNVFYYNDAFYAADPPTGYVGKQSKMLQPDSVFQVMGYTSLALDKEGFYLFQTDTTSTEATGIRVVDDSFPKYGSISEITETMIYITSGEEWAKISDPNISKKEFDRVWMDISGTSTQAQAAIKYYFRGIYESNQMFTTFKPGWMTDKGMIYTIFGPPDHVYVDGKEEYWEYLETLNHGPIEFSFISVPTLFSPYHSILRRNSSYKLPWHRTIDRLRRGTPNYEQ